MFKKITSIILVGLFLFGSLNSTQAQPQIKKEVIRRPEPKISEEAIEKPAQEIRTKVDRVISDTPIIREFSITPNFWVQGQAGTAIIRWRMESIPGGSPINSITVTGPELNYLSSNLTGQCNVNILSYPYPTRLHYTLTAVNAEGRSATRELNFEVKSPIELREQISFERIYTQPAQFPDGSPYTVIFRLNNRSDIRLTGVLIQIRYTNFIPWAVTAASSLNETPARIELREQIINLGINEYRFRDTLSVIDGPWTVGHLRGQYFIYIWYDRYLLLTPVPIVDILVAQTEPPRLFRIHLR